MIACVRRRCVDVGGGGRIKVGKNPKKKNNRNLLK